MYKKIYICKHILLYNYYTVYAYFIMDIIMHICILSFIYFNKRYIVHLYYFSDSLFFFCSLHTRLWCACCHRVGRNRTTAQIPPYDAVCQDFDIKYLIISSLKLNCGLRGKKKTSLCIELIRRNWN